MKVKNKICVLELRWKLSRGTETYALKDATKIPVFQWCFLFSKVIFWSGGLCAKKNPILHFG